MKRNWVVIANAARARVLEESDRVGRYAHVADLVHPASRLSGTQLAELHGGSRPGRIESQAHGTGSAAYEPRTSPREREHERFAHEVAQVLNQGVAGGRCAGLTLVASDPFLGALKSHLSVQSRKVLLRTVGSDCTALRDEEVAQRLGWVAA